MLPDPFAEARVDFGNCERKRLAKLNKPSRYVHHVLKNKLTKYDNVQRLFEDSICTVKSTGCVTTLPSTWSPRTQGGSSAARTGGRPCPTRLWTQPKGDKTIRKMLKDAIDRPRTAPLLSRGGVAFETPLLERRLRMGSFRVGPAHDKGGVSAVESRRCQRRRGAEAREKMCVSARRRENTFRFPPGLATGNDGETQLCCFKSVSVPSFTSATARPSSYLAKEMTRSTMSEDDLDGPRCPRRRRRCVICPSRKLSESSSLRWRKTTMIKRNTRPTTYFVRRASRARSPSGPVEGRHATAGLGARRP